MENINHILKNILDRQKMLSPELKGIKNQLEMAYERNALESGVIDRGYFTSFHQILNENRHIVGRFMVSEEQYTDNRNGMLIKIPVVDVMSMNTMESQRIFILPKSILRDNQIDNLFN